MNTMRNSAFFALTWIVLTCCLAVSSRADVAPAPQRPKVQIAVLLDTSNSMDGLIEQAKTQLWRIVNEFATARQGGQIPDLEVALFQYGTPSLGEENGYVRMILPLTGDLDKVSQELFALKTDGGDEYCGAVIGKAVEQLSWSPGANDYKAIFIAGNEPFTQGSVDYRQTCKAAIERGIIVNTIHCGTEQEGIDGKWKDGALLADGSFSSIDQNSQTVHIVAPQDDEIEALGAKLNETYLAYGQVGREAVANQAAQDSNAAAAAPGASLQRSVAKASALYRADWDLATAVKDGQVKLEEVEVSDLPKEMQKMSLEERKQHIEKELAAREQIRQRISELNDQRNAYVAEEMKKQSAAAGGPETLDSAIIRTVRDQAQKRNFEFSAGGGAATQPTD